MSHYIGILDKKFTIIIVYTSILPSLICGNLISSPVFANYDLLITKILPSEFTSYFSIFNSFLLLCNKSLINSNNTCSYPKIP